MPLILDRLRRRAGADRLVEEKGQKLRIRLIIDRRPTFRGGKSLGLVQLSDEGGHADALKLKAAHKLLEAHSMGVLSNENHSYAIAPTSQRHRQLMALGLLAPTVQKRILKAETDTSFRLMGRTIPLAWADQHRTFLGNAAKHIAEA